MWRIVLAAALALALAAVAGGARLQLETLGVSRVPASLLYLPKGPYLRLLTLGQEELAADLLYIWAIQYYSNYEDRSRYEYLDAVFRGAITELDPLYTDAYLLGALIMSAEARRPDLALALYDKGLEKMPGNWQLAYWAGWEAYTTRQYAAARRYWLRAATMPGAPPEMERLAARMLEKAGDRDAAIAEYERLLALTTDKDTRKFVQQWLDRLLTDRALEQTRSAIAAFKARRGRCPAQLEALVEEGLLPSIPQGAGGTELHYDRSTCEVLPAPRQSFGGGS